MMMNKTFGLIAALRSTGVVLTFSLLMAAPAHSTLVTNGAPNASGGGLVIDTFMGAESFVVTVPETIYAIEFAVNYYVPVFNDTLNYAIFDNNGFFPGTMKTQGSNPLV